MTFTVKCFCGAVVQTDDEESLIAQVGDHVSQFTTWTCRARTFSPWPTTQRAEAER